MIPTVTPIPTGLTVPSQVPLNAKEYFINEADLSNLGLNNELAFSYYKGMSVYCALENTRYIWNEVQGGETKLLVNDYVYPDGWEAEGIDYSNKVYNFLLDSVVIPTPSLQEVLNTGNYATQGDPSITFASFRLNEEGLENIVQRINVTNHSSILRTINELAQLSNYYSPTNNQNNSVAGQYRSENGLISIEQNINGVSGKTTKVAYQTPAFNISLLFPAKSANGTYVIATEDQIPVIDGSETKVIDSDTIKHTGTGTIADPFKLVTINKQKIITSNYTITEDDNNTSLKVNNGATAITITFPISLSSAFFIGITQRGTGDITLAGAVGATLTNLTGLGLKIKGQGYYVGVEQIGTSNTFDVLGNTKV